MTDPDPIPARMEAFDRENGRDRLQEPLTLTATGPHRTAQAGRFNTMRVGSWQNRWKDVGDMGGLVLPLDEALDAIANTEIFWTWTSTKSS